MRWKLSCNHTGSLLSHQYTNPNPAPGPLHWLHLKHSSPQSAWLTPSLLADCFQNVILSESASLTTPFNIAHMHTPPHIHTSTLTVLHSYTQMCTQTREHSHVHAHTTYSHVCKHTHTHGHTHLCTHPPTHTHTLTLLLHLYPPSFYVVAVITTYK